MWTLVYNAVEQTLADWRVVDDYARESENKGNGSVTLRTAEAFDAGPTQWLAGEKAVIYRDRLQAAGAGEGDDGVALCVVGIGHAHPEALLLRLFQEDAGLAGAFHPDLIPYQARLRDEVLGGASGDPYQAAWTLLEDLQREGWVMPLPNP